MRLPHARRLPPGFVGHLGRLIPAPVIPPSPAMWLVHRGYQVAPRSMAATASLPTHRHGFPDEQWG
jgi:hypothetical protein